MELTFRNGTRFLIRCVAIDLGLPLFLNPVEHRLVVPRDRRPVGRIRKAKRLFVIAVVGKRFFVIRQLRLAFYPQLNAQLADVRLGAFGILVEHLLQQVVSALPPVLQEQGGPLEQRRNGLAPGLNGLYARRGLFRFPAVIRYFFIPRSKSCIKPILPMSWL